MIKARQLILSLLVLSIATTAALALTIARSSEDDPQLPRVIVRVSRNLEVAGYVEDEDETIIVIRKLDDEIESYSKSRVVSIVRLAEPKPGQSGIVILRNGQRREGIIIEDTFDHVLIEAEGIRAKLLREAVDYVILRPTFQQQYKNWKAAIGPTQHVDHYRLCDWLVNQRKYELAKIELVELVKISQMPEAMRLLTIVEAQLALDKGRPKNDEVGDPDSDQSSRTYQGHDDPNVGPVDDKDLLPTELLSYEDVNLMRVYEIDFHNPPHLVIGPDTIRKLISTYASNKLIPTGEKRTAMFRADPLDITRLMFELKARDLYKEIKVQTEPYAMNLFRRRVHDTWLINNCATSRCHGGIHAGEFFLHRRGHKNERVRYTNFLILERLEIDPDWPLINYEQPMDSLIIQYGLKRSEARKPHPDVRGWKPVFARSNKRMLDDAGRWIRSMLQPRPDYPIEYEPPRLAPDVPKATPSKDRISR